MPGSAWRWLGAFVLLTACGDPPTNDRRGYTKAPLEKAGAFVRGEERSDVARFGRPNLPVAEPIQIPDSANTGR